jgi:putative addiction module CopG family antidote
MTEQFLSKKKTMRITLTKELESLIKKKVTSGRYTDESDVVRDALRALEQRDDFESPALEAALLEGVRSGHRQYNKRTLNRIRTGASELND